MHLYGLRGALGCICVGITAPPITDLEDLSIGNIPETASKPFLAPEPIGPGNRPCGHVSPRVVRFVYVKALFELIRK